MDIFTKNLQALAYVNTTLALTLKAHKDNKKYEVFMGSDPADYNIIDKINAIPLYKTEPIDEIMAKNENLKNYSYYPFLYLYGFGSGVLIKLLLTEYRKRIVVFEPELEILFIALNLIDFSSDILSRKLFIALSEQISYMSIDSLFETSKLSRLYVKTYDLIVTNSYYDSYSDDLLRINGYFMKSIEHLVVSVGNDANDSVVGIANHIANLPDVLKSPSLKNLIDSIKKRDTAIIVSTGPSLYKQIPLLKEIAPYATLLCIDASFPILYKAGIKPDIVLSMERVEATARFYYDTPLEAQEGVVFAITSIVHKRLKDSIKKGTIQFSFRPFGYTSLFGFQDYGYIGIGMSAANMAYELAVYSEFKRCIFIGQDLAFGEDGTSHSHGAIYGEKEITPKDKKEDKLFVTKYGGNGKVETTKVWQLFLNFFEKDIANTKTGMEVINSTEGGARIQGTKEIPFKEAIKLIDKSSIKSPIKLTPPSAKKAESNIKKARKTCNDIINYGTRMQKRIEKVFLELTKELEKIEALNKTNELEKINFKKLDSISEKIDNIKKLFNEKKFTNYFLDAIQSYIFHQELDIARSAVIYPKDEEELKAKKIQLLYQHKYWLFSLAGGINCVVEIIKQNLEKW